MTFDTLAPVDVIVVGGGNAALNAALSAHENGASVILLEAAPEHARGGNSAFTGGAFRFSFATVEELKQLSPEIADLDLNSIDFGSYTEDQYFDDMGRLTEYRCEPNLTEILIKNSLDAAMTMRRYGVRFQPSLGRQAFKVDGKFRFWGGLACQIWGGGQQLVSTLHAAAEKLGIKTFYETSAEELLHDDSGVCGVRVRHQGRHHDLRARAVVLACGGFEANAEMRARYLGPSWDLAKVRGSRFNTGNGHRMAMAVGAEATGHWSGAHAVQWDMNAPQYGDLTVGDRFQKHNYPFGIVVNALGERFLDEGADFHSYTYAKYGREILNQPGLFAWQVFDQKIVGLLREEYRIARITKETANTLEELAPKLTGVDPKRFLETVNAFNAAARPDVPFDPNIHDGLATVGLAVNKSNWANKLDEPPFHAYGVTCGITFTFGGLKISNDAEVEEVGGRPIRGLFAAGEIVGGLYYHNYASGTGLAAGTVFGKIAGRQAARSVRH
jgi:tricarballylate dehydrogenase